MSFIAVAPVLANAQVNGGDDVVSTPATPASGTVASPTVNGVTMVQPQQTQGLVAQLQHRSSTEVMIQTSQLQTLQIQATQVIQEADLQAE